MIRGAYVNDGCWIWSFEIAFTDVFRLVAGSRL